MNDCIFCKIIKGEIPSYKIYEDKWVYSFLDISNDGNGHILVIPKNHCENVMTCSDEDLSHVMSAIKLISNHLIKNCGFSGVNIINASGQSAEQTVFHLHFHLLPRKDKDGIKVFPKLKETKKSLEEMCELLKVKQDKKVVLYTDGACSGNPGMGGYSAILFAGSREKVLSGGEKETTNNRMELKAVIEGLKALKGSCEVEIYSDSAYVVNAFLEDWITDWEKKGWRTTKGEVANLDLWKELVSLTKKHDVKWNKVKGHADNEYNNRCDALARGEIEKLRKNAD